MIRNAVWIAAGVAIASASQADAAVAISSGPTENMTCSAGVCAPTADDAVLNVGDLNTLLASGNVEVVTYAKHVRARDILIESAFSSTASNTLSLDAGGQLRVKKRISMQGSGGLSLYARRLYVEGPVSISGSGGLMIGGIAADIDGPVSIEGTSGFSIQARQMKVEQLVSIQGSGAVVISGHLSFTQNGRIIFAGLSTSVTVNGAQYTLANSLPGLAAAIAASPQGYFGLANSYDASADGTYTTSPIPTNFLGSFEGFGNTISRISVNNTAGCCVGGLFQSISQGSVTDVRLANISVTSVQGAAGLAYESFGAIAGISVTGSISGGGSGDIAGLVSDNYGSIESSYSAAAVSAGATVSGTDVGGLIGVEYGYTENSFAMGAVSAGHGSGNLGGLIGENANVHNQNLPQNCYATGNVSGGAGLNVGGLIGTNDYGNGFQSAIYCYSTGAISGGSGSTAGGLIGVNNGFVSGDYWDTTTSGTDVGVGLGNASGVTGLSTAQLQSGLPAGFDPRAWRENARINNGLPYLRLNQPPN